MSEYTTATDEIQEGRRGALLQAALAAAAAGIAVFPCGPDDPSIEDPKLRAKAAKKPATLHGFKDATTDAAQIRAWWDQNPNYNLAFSPGAMGWSVIDLDEGKVGRDTWAELQLNYGAASDTYEVETPRGGLHLYFEGLLRSTVRDLGPGVDTRSEGGYVLLPPSIVCGNPYVALNSRELGGLPLWVQPLVAPKPTASKSATDKQDLPHQVAAALRFLEARAPAIADGTGDAWTLKTAYWMRDLGLSEDKALEIMMGDWNARCEPPWDREEMAVKVHNAFNYSQNEAGAYASPLTMADVAAPYMPEPGASRVAASDAGTAGEEDPELDRARRELPAYSPLAGATRPRLEFWPGTSDLLPKGGSTGRVGFIVAPSHQGKSTIEIALLLDACLAGARILFCAGEGADDVMAQQLPAACQARGITLEDLTATGRWLTVEGVPLLRDSSLVNGFIKLYADHRPDIVAFDTWATAIMGLKEDSAETGGLLTGNGPVGVIARSWKATILLAHHTGKDETRGGRGSSSFHGNSDFFLLLSADKLARVSTAAVDKMRGGRSGYSQSFSVEPGLNGIGVAQPIEARDAARRRKRVTPGDKARAEVAGALWALSAAGHGGNVAPAVLADETYRLREERRIEEAEAAGETYQRPTPEESQAEVDNIRKNLIYAHAKETKAKDGGVACATLDAFIAKDRSGARLDPLQFRLPQTVDMD